MLGCGNSTLSEDVSEAFDPLLSTAALEFFVDARRGLSTDR